MKDARPFTSAVRSGVLFASCRRVTVRRALCVAFNALAAAATSKT